MKSHVDSTEELRIISLCSGSLGLERGITRSGTAIRSIAHVEREAFICFNLAKQMEAGLVDAAPIWTDVKTFDASPFRNRIHGIVGGYPCQGESSAGKREGMDYEGFLFHEIEGQIIASNPLFCFFENVGAHLSGTFPYVLTRLRGLGFHVEAGLFTAAEVGAPHKRERLFILAWADTDEMRRCLANARSQQGYVSNQSRRREKATASEGRYTLADTYSTRLQGGREQGICRQPLTSQGGESGGVYEQREVLSDPLSIGGQERSGKHFTEKPHDDGCQWPAPPGRRQHAFEAPRVTGGAKTESGMGCSINGYDFRSDLLRMYGNGVVEQTAALAWRSLTELI